MNQDSLIIKLLLKTGGDIKSTNSKGLSVADLANRPGKRDIKEAISEVLPECFNLKVI